MTRCHVLIIVGRVRAMQQFQTVWRTRHCLITEGSYVCITITCHMYSKCHWLITAQRASERCKHSRCHYQVVFNEELNECQRIKMGCVSRGTFTSKCNLFCKTFPLVVITSTFRHSRTEHSENYQDVLYVCHVTVLQNVRNRKGSLSRS